MTMRIFKVEGQPSEKVLAVCLHDVELLTQIILAERQKTSAIVELAQHDFFQSIANLSLYNEIKVKKLKREGDIYRLAEFCLEQIWQILPKTEPL